MTSARASSPAGLGLVLSAEHASNTLPEEMDHEGLDGATLASHAAWDPGAAEVARDLATRLGAPLFLGRYSRLFVDLNRSPSSPEVVPVRAFGVEVPGNQRLSPEARAERIRRHHTPHWDHVRAALVEVGPPVLHLAVHSFTPVLGTERRTLDLGVLFDPARRLERQIAALLLPALARGGYDARANEPYDGRADALPTALRPEHGEDDYAGVELEISHALLPALPRVSAVVLEALRSLPLRARSPAP